MLAEPIDLALGPWAPALERVDVVLQVLGEKLAGLPAE